MERRPQRGTNRGRSGMVARSTDGHKTNASLGAEHLERVGIGGAKRISMEAVEGTVMSFVNDIDSLDSNKK